MTYETTIADSVFPAFGLGFPMIPGGRNGIATVREAIPLPRQHFHEPCRKGKTNGRP